MYRFLTSFYRSGLVLTGTESVVLHMSEGGTTRVSGTAYAGYCKGAKVIWTVVSGPGRFH